MLTGLGVVASTGHDAGSFWQSLCNGRSGVSRIGRFDTSRHRMAIAGEVKDFDATRIVSTTVKTKRLSRQTQFALSACIEAVGDAGLSREDLTECRMPILYAVGTSSSSFDLIEKAKDELDERGPTRVNPLLVASGQPNATSAALSAHFGAHCLTTTFSTACTAGFDAVLAAYECVRRGGCDIAIAGGTDALVTPLGMACFWSSGLLPDWTGEPSAACRPFDRDRQGGVLAEGAAFVVLESSTHALARGARPYATLLGFGSSVDAPGSDPGSGFGPAIATALSNAYCIPEDIDYVVAHGPGDPVIDQLETEALRRQLRGHAYRIPVTSIKGSTGNPLSAAGPLQLVTGALAMRNDLVPPTVNHEHNDAHCDLDYNPGRARSARLERILINLHGMGGRNISAVVENAQR